VREKAKRPKSRKAKNYYRQKRDLPVVPYAFNLPYFSHFYKPQKVLESMLKPGNAETIRRGSPNNRPTGNIFGLSPCPTLANAAACVTSKQRAAGRRLPAKGLRFTFKVCAGRDSQSGETHLIKGQVRHRRGGLQITPQIPEQQIDRQLGE
jgi:hypothetical protein